MCHQGTLIFEQESRLQDVVIVTIMPHSHLLLMQKFHLEAAAVAANAANAAVAADAASAAASEKLKTFGRCRAG